MSCPLCGAVVYQYTDAFLQLWEDAMRMFPLYSLPEPRHCRECIDDRVNWWNIVRSGSKADRKAWLQGTSGLETLDMSSPDTLRSIERGKRKYHALQKLRKKQSRKLLKLRARREWRGINRKLKAKNKAINAVLEQAQEVFTRAIEE